MYVSNYIKRTWLPYLTSSSLSVLINSDFPPLLKVCGFSRSPMIMSPSYLVENVLIQVPILFCCGLLLHILAILCRGAKRASSRMGGPPERNMTRLFISFFWKTPIKKNESMWRSRAGNRIFWTHEGCGYSYCSSGNRSEPDCATPA